MGPAKNHKEAVEVNRKFYNSVAKEYDRIDGRRATYPEWLHLQLNGLAAKTGAQTFVDLGAGTGYISRLAARYFHKVWAVDISQKMLEEMLCRPGCPSNIESACYDIVNLPFRGNTIDVCCAYAVLHHIKHPVSVFGEAYRVLKPGGYLYSDQDVEWHFVNRFGLALRCYRAIKDYARKYSDVHPDVTEELYRDSEVWSEGIDSVLLLEQLQSIGFCSIEHKYTWRGVSFNMDGSRGSAPIFTFTARKPIWGAK